MSVKSIGATAENHECIPDKIQEMTLNSIRKVLPDKAIEDACVAVGYTHRRRLVTPVVTVLHMILAAIWPEESFAASWHVLWSAFVSRFGDAGTA